MRTNSRKKCNANIIFEEIRQVFEFYKNVISKLLFMIFCDVSVILPLINC